MEKIAIITGLSLNKRSSSAYYSQIAKDQDLVNLTSFKKLKSWLKMGNTWFKTTLKSLLTLISFLLAALSLVFINWNNINILIFIQSIVAFIIGVYFLTSACITYRNMKKRGNSLKVMHNQYREGIQNLKIFTRHFNKPLDIWQMFVSNSSDMQAAMHFILNKHNVAIYYTGGPYYNIFFVDSIYINFNAPKECSKDIKKKYKELAVIGEDILKKTLDDLKFDYVNEYHETHKRPELNRDSDNKFSAYVFGIKFLSTYFYNMSKAIETKKDRVLSEFRFDEMRFFIEKPKGITLKDGKEIEAVEIENFELYTEVIKQILDVSVHFRGIKWLYKENDIEEAKLHYVCLGISMTALGVKSADYKKRMRKKYEKTLFLKRHEQKNYFSPKNVVRIPLKRPFAVPKGSKNGLFPKAVEDFINVKESDSVFFIGGVEHNLALLWIIREYRKSFTQNEDFGRYLGIVENKFDYEYKPNLREKLPLMISCEKLVQAFYFRLKGRAKKINYSYAGEFFKLIFKSTENVYLLFGYSAPMTQVICVFLSKYMEYYLDKVNKDTNRSVLLFYNDGECSEHSIYDWPALDRWNSCNIINGCAHNSTSKERPYILIDHPANERLFDMYDGTSYWHNKIYNPNKEENWKSI